MAQDIELTDIFTFDVEKNLIIGDPKEEQLPNANPKAQKITTYRIPIMARYPNGKIGPLIVPTLENLFSFGIQENRDTNGNLTGYSMPICLVGRKEETDEEKAQREREKEWTEKLEAVFQKISDHVVSIKYKVKARELVKIKSPIYRKVDDEGNIVEGSSPMLYPKLLASRPKRDLVEKLNDNEVKELESHWKILTPFDDSETGESIDPLSLKGTYLTTESAVKIESVFCGAQVTHQIKLHQSIVKRLQSGPKKLLSFKPKPAEKVTLETNFNPLANNNDDDPPIRDEDEHDTEEVPKKVTKKVIRKKN